MHPFFAVVAAAGVRASRRRARWRPRTPSRRSTTACALGADGLELDVRLSRDGDGRRAPRSDARSDNRAARPDRRPDRRIELHARERAAARRRASPRYRDVRIIIEMKVNNVELAAAAARRWSRPRRRRRAASASARSDGACCARRARSSRAVATSARARGGALGALPIVVPLAGVARRLRRLSDSGVGRPHPRRVAAVRVDDAHGAGLGVQVWTVDTRGRRAALDRRGASTR